MFSYVKKGVMMKKIFAMMLMILFVSSTLCAAEKTSSLEKYLDEKYRAAFKNVEYFGFIDVSLQGDAEKIGLSRTNLSEYLRLKIRNNFRDIKIDLNKLPSSRFQVQDPESVGSIELHVWTVGDNYPIALHVELKAGNWKEVDSYPYHDATLGYGSKEKVPDAIKKAINDMVEKFAITFYKARKEI